MIYQYFLLRVIKLYKSLTKTNSTFLVFVVRCNNILSIFSDLDNEICMLKGVIQ